MTRPNVDVVEYPAEIAADLFDVDGPAWLLACRDCGAEWLATDCTTALTAAEVHVC